MAHVERLCGYCAYMDLDTIRRGRYKCERDGEWRYADDDVARDCCKFCAIFWSKLDKARAAVAESRRYRSAGCFVATAIMEILGFDENCAELEALRFMRNDKVSVDPEFRSKLMYYDVLGPIIAGKLLSEPNNEELAKDLYLAYIKGTVDYINNGEFDKAIELYGEMTRMLVAKYINSYEIGDKAAEQYDVSAGGHNAFSKASM